jgi:hypothetical protein
MKNGVPTMLRTKSRELFRGRHTPKSPRRMVMSLHGRKHTSIMHNITLIAMGIPRYTQI